MARAEVPSVVFLQEKYSLEEKWGNDSLWRNEYTVDWPDPAFQRRAPSVFPARSRQKLVPPQTGGLPRGYKNLCRKNKQIRKKFDIIFTRAADKTFAKMVAMGGFY